MANSSKQDTLLPAYLAVGEDQLKRTAVVKRLYGRLSKEGDLAFNSDEFDGETAAGSDIVSACNTVPFASPVRLVTLRNAEKLKKADSEMIVAYLGAPNPTTILLLEAEKLAKSTRLYKAVAKLGKTAVIDCAPPKRAALPGKVREMAVAQGVTFTQGAATKLVELVGENTVRLNSEVEKIALAHDGSSAVGEQEVESLVRRSAEVKPWEFVDAVSARDLKKCLLCLGRMESMAPIALITMCATRLRELICARSLCDRGTPRALAQTLKVPDWRVKNHIGWARGFTAEELRRAMVLARDADRAMKSGSDAHQVLLDWTLAVVPRTKK